MTEKELPTQELDIDWTMAIGGWNYNPRPERHGTEKEFAADLNAKIRVPIDYLSELAIGANADYETFLYMKDKDLGGDKLILKDLGISAIPFKREFHDHILGVSTIRDPEGKQYKEFNAKTIKGFKAVPEDGGMALLHLQIQLDKEAERYQNLLSDGMKNELFICIFKRGAGLPLE